CGAWLRDGGVVNGGGGWGRGWGHYFLGWEGRAGRACDSDLFNPATKGITFRPESARLRLTRRYQHHTSAVPGRYRSITYSFLQSLPRSQRLACRDRSRSLKRPCYRRLWLQPYKPH